MDNRRGFKIVNADGCSFQGSPPVHYVVGETYRLPEDQKPEACKQGFHYCPRAIDCLSHLSTVWHPSYRLLAVEATKDSVIVDDGRKVVTSALTVLADVTSDVPRLLSGAVATRWVQDTYASGRHHSIDGAASAVAIHTHGGATLTWHDDGQPCRTVVLADARNSDRAALDAGTVAVIERLLGTLPMPPVVTCRCSM
jgi:hypothetical protein